ncbi:MAG: Gfo/Idh/MocA family oxidoreductase, partial [Planctomycetota bacterium]
MIRFGIVGCGHIAHRHAQHITAHGEAELARVFDIRPERTSAFADRHGTRAAGTLDELLADPELDIVNVCTPNGSHCDVTLECLSKGKHVLVEKPMAIRRLSCERMVDRALKRNRQLFVVKQNRFNPPVAALKDLIDDGALGPVYLVVVNCFWNRNRRYYEESDWKGTRDLDGGTLFTQFSHFVDVMYYLFGDVIDIQGSTANANHQGLIEFEDSGVFTFRFLEGAMGSLSYTTACFERNYEGSRVTGRCPLPASDTAPWPLITPAERA